MCSYAIIGSCAQPLNLKINITGNKFTIILEMIIISITSTILFPFLCFLYPDTPDFLESSDNSCIASHAKLCELSPIIVCALIL